MERHLWLVQAVAWVRGSGIRPGAAVVRLRHLLDAAEARPGWHEAWQAWWRNFTRDVDLTPLLADYGFAPRAAFLSEFSNRLRMKLLPGTPETTDVADLFALVFSHPDDVHWLRAIDGETLQRLSAWFVPVPADAAAPQAWVVTLLDAVMFATSQVSATGFAPEIRLRMSDDALAARTFQALPMAFERLRTAVLEHGPQSGEAWLASDALRQQLDACRHAAYTVYAHLQEHGISVGIVFRLRQLRERVLRIKALLEVLQSPEPQKPCSTLLADLVQLRFAQRSLRALLAGSLQLLSARVAERSAESGEHYITRDRQEYRGMLLKSAGGGAVVGLTVWSKFAMALLGLGAFWNGLALGLNYAMWFVLIQLLHWTLATKQPAVTAPAMVARLRHIREPRAVRGFVDEVANLLRSQMVAIAGNLLLVVPTVLLLGALWQWWQAAPPLDEHETSYVLASLSLAGPAALFAAFTGVLLFASSLVAGWAENWFVYHRLDSALAHHPRSTRWLGRERAARWAHWWRDHISGLAANVSLGLMLGLVPAFAAFFGLGLEVRHVTLSAGQLAAATMALGWEFWREPAFWWAVGGVAVIGPINVGVSFFLAFRLALRAQNVTATQRDRIRASLWRRLWRHPLTFVLPPPGRERPGSRHG